MHSPWQQSPRPPEQQPPSGQPTLSQTHAEAALQREGGHVLFLGTGCAEPSKYRGSSGVHLRLGNSKGLLIDAGEGILGQLVRHYGPALAQQQVCWLPSLSKDQASSSCLLCL